MCTCKCTPSLNNVITDVSWLNMRPYTTNRFRVLTCIGSINIIVEQTDQPILNLC